MRVCFDLIYCWTEQEGHLMANKRCELPQGSQRISHKGYEEVPPKPHLEPFFFITVKPRVE